ncbi:antibiotic biosynthesis monooxygenase [Polynucleobacter sp. MWH-Loch1C5]|jgi:heme-degrading monooxygenase HmoA|uniref:antibiotic biosynthesis monooxygenase family protein n=1 Tax=Polynucleobacter sp. MWH-Loch1C5 TaxID=2689108 RepID=UPI001C0D04B4|nr:antibiotic biosynthesis monooxygenase [Polynucleobacter sp. MWH-Loch1C5]MBU3542045.1 antibiotic biosynthesis monooxygenase [Polynucleobacter sp. MWH-Loch1C5]
MILEVVDIQIDPAKRAEFEQAVAQGVAAAIVPAKGFRGYKLNAGIEQPGRFLLMIYWDTLENHTVDFRGSDAFALWRSHVGPYFLNPPQVEHFTLSSKSA